MKKEDFVVRLWSRSYWDIHKDKIMDQLYNDTSNKGKNSLRILSSTKSRAKKKGMPCDITKEWYLSKLKKSNYTCEATGYPFNMTYKIKSKRPYVPSIHRLDPSKGYTMDNCAIVCWAWNRMVGDSTDGITQTLIKAFIEKTKRDAKEAKKACIKTPSMFDC